MSGEPKIEYVYERDEDETPWERKENIEKLRPLATRTLRIWSEIDVPGKEYVKCIQICDHLDGACGQAYKKSFALAQYSTYGECSLTDEQLKSTIEHETAHVYKINNPEDKYESEEFARMYQSELGTEWKQQYDIWYESLAPDERLHIKRQYYVYEKNAEKARQNALVSGKRYLFIILPNKVLIPFGHDPEHSYLPKTKKAKFVLYVID